MQISTIGIDIAKSWFHFVGLPMDEPVWAPTVFTKNRDRLLNQQIARSFFRRVVERAQGLMSDELSLPESQSGR